MRIRINRNSTTPLYLQIENAIKEMIINGELLDGYKLLSERGLADELGVHRNTVIKAYDNLISEGLIVSSHTAPRGYFVLKNEKMEHNPIFFPLTKMIQYSFSSKEKEFQEIYDQSGCENVISLGGMVMSDEISPESRISDILEKMKNGEWARKIRENEDSEIERLKSNICMLMRERNTYINKKNVQIVSETTEALNHIISLYLKPGDCIVAEQPIVPDVVNLFRNKGIEIAYVNQEADGINLKELELMILRKAPKFIYVMPNFHNPTGVVMSLKKRIELLEISRKYGIPIIEEDSLRDFNYKDKGYPTLYSMDRYKSVLYIDTFSLTFLPGIKTAFIIGPYEAIEMIGHYIVMTQVILSNIGQYMLNEFIESGEYERYLQDMRQYYLNKRNHMVAALSKIQCGEFTFVIPEGGLYIWCDMGTDVNERELVQACRNEGLIVMPGHLFYPNGYQGGCRLRLCYSNIKDEKIEEAVSILDRAIKQSIRNNETLSERIITE